MSTHGATPGGGFVVTASAAGLLTMIGDAPYSVSKHAAVAFAEWLSITYGEAGVVVQCICPQGVRTKLFEDAGSLRSVLERDPVLTAGEVADAVWKGLADDRFLILPHPQVRSYYQKRAQDTDRWLAGMRRLQQTIERKPTPGGRSGSDKR